MILVDSRLLKTYMEHDSLLEILVESAQEDDEKFNSHKLLLKYPEKRMLYFYMYGGFPISHRKSSILDVGGGYCSYTRKLLEIADYTLLDPMQHEDYILLKKIVGATGKDFWLDGSWEELDVSDKEYDLVISNNLFPNVDQRLDFFLKKYLPHCRELRMSLAFYNTPKWYKVKKADGFDLTMLAWNGSQVRDVLLRYQQSFVMVPHWELLDSTESVYEDGRQIAIVKLIGELA